MGNNIIINRPFVFVRCLTYNHEPYIEDALKGFAMQQTDFPFVVAVVDDASTDNNASVIVNYVAKHCDCKSNYVDEEKDYGHVIQAHPLTNPNCLLHIVLLKENHFRKKSKRPYYAEYEDAAKYVALCEGDDYWTDPLKLQKQVDFMENHPDVGLCYTNYNVYYEDNALLELAKFQNGMHRSQNFEDHLLTRGYIAPMTWMCRRDVYYKLIQQIGIHTDGSFALALEFYHFSNVAYIDEVTATYRVHENSASRQIDPEKKWQYDLGVMETQLEYAQKYGDDALVQKVCLNSYLINLLPLAITLNKQDFIQTAREYANSIGLIFDDYLALIKLSLKREKQYYLIQESHSYRLGKLLLKPFRWMKRKK